MTDRSDILGRPPARKPRPEADTTLPDIDWRGEHHWRITRSNQGGGHFNMSNAIRNAAKTQKSEH